MSFYTGRYVQSHGATWNGIRIESGRADARATICAPGRADRPGGQDAHARGSAKAWSGCGIDPNSIIGVRVSECGFDPFDRDDGLHAAARTAAMTTGKAALQALPQRQGLCRATIPGTTVPTRHEGEGNALASGWAMRQCAQAGARYGGGCRDPLHDPPRHGVHRPRPARTPWCVHLSYIKPHWPYVAPAPYNDMYDGR